MSERSISVNGMTVQWQHDHDTVRFEAFAPMQGWVALGFNLRDEIVGSNLIMGAVENGIVKVEDHYVLRHGEHRPVDSLGGTTAVKEAQGSEDRGGTIIRFTIPQKAIDQFHFDLSSGTPLYLILAYSLEDDFDHHSAMRVHQKVIL
jgi:hypothetical protein